MRLAACILGRAQWRHGRFRDETKYNVTSRHSCSSDETDYSPSAGYRHVFHIAHWIFISMIAYTSSQAGLRGNETHISDVKVVCCLTFSHDSYKANFELSAMCHSVLSKMCLYVINVFKNSDILCLFSVWNDHVWPSPQITNLPKAHCFIISACNTGCP